MNSATWLIALLTLPLLAAPASARADLLAEETVASERLGRDLLYSVYLPPDYPEPGRSYPVLYLLHGLGDDHRSWPQAGIEAILDEAIASGDAAPLIVVMPDAGGSWYGDAPDGPGPIRSAILEDLLPEIDAAFPTDGRRGVAGHSMGAQGALTFALRNPDLFDFAAAMNISPGPAFVARMIDGGTVSDERAHGWLGGGYGVPFDAARYRADLPEVLAETVYPTRAPRLRLTASDDDPYDTHLRSVALYQMLRDRGIEPELRITDGGHSWSVWKAELPRLITAFTNVDESN